MSTTTFLQSLGLMPTMPTSIASPYSESSLTSIVFSDIFGADYVAPLNRADAMAIAPVSKARQILTGVISRMPIRVLDASGVLPDAKQPAWCYRTDGTVSPSLRMTWTVDDLLFFGHSLWLCDRGTDGSVLRAERCPIELWRVTPEGSILVNDEPVDARSVIYFPGHIEGLLARAQTTLRSARNIDRAVERRASSPIPVMEVHLTDPDAPLTPEEARELVTAYNKARLDIDGATVFTPSHIELKPHGDRADSGAQIEARNALRLDIANHTGLPASSLEGSLSTASLTYSTAEGQRQTLADLGLAPFIDTIASRLSMDDVVLPGQRVRLDASDIFSPTPSATGAQVQD